MAPTPPELSYSPNETCFSPPSPTEGDVVLEAFKPQPPKYYTSPSINPPPDSPNLSDAHDDSDSDGSDIIVYMRSPRNTNSETLHFSSGKDFSSNCVFRAPLKSTNAEPIPIATTAQQRDLGHFYSEQFPCDHKLNNQFLTHYVLEDELGAGGYGFVMTAKNLSNGSEVAVKFIVKDRVPEHAWMEDEHIGRLPTEVMLLSFIDHENIVKCLDLFEDSVYFYLVICILVIC
jgi:hypothetical protein